MENEKLTYINSRGERLELGVDSVYHCNISKDVEGISGVTSVIYSTNSMGQHGDTYVGQRIEARDIDVVGHINTRDKHELGVDAYIRYMDDFVILSPDKEQLRSWLAQIEQFLREELKLEFNPKTTILAAKNGIDFVGYKHRATHRKVRKDSIKRIKRTIKKCESGKITKEQLQKSIQSWTGHAGHADSYNLRKKIETLAEAAIEKAA